MNLTVHISFVSLQDFQCIHCTSPIESDDIIAEAQNPSFPEI